MDSDDTGIKRSIELNKRWNLEYILIPKEYERKDISDFNKKYGREKSKKLLRNLII